jgi:hypothetical protein
VSGLQIHVAWFEVAQVSGRPAIGTCEDISWPDFVSVVCDHRRIGDKDGPGFVPARFNTEQPGGRHVRRLARNAIARTAVALDCEPSKKTGELPPMPAEVAERLQRKGWAGVVYTSHSHVRGSNIRYRVVVPLSEEIEPDLPACEVVASQLNLEGVLDTSKVGPAAFFYLPSCGDEEALGQHEALICHGQPIDAGWMRDSAGAVLAQRQAEQERLAAEAHAEAAARREAKLAAGIDPDDSLIEKIRGRLDLDSALLGHGYDKQAGKYRHPNSSSGQFGADIKTFSGIERVYSHNATDPLHRDNLPQWCTVTAIDAFDVTAILDFSGDRTRALRELAQRFGLSKDAERRAIAKLIFRMIRQQAPQEAIEASAFAEGLRLGLSRDEVCRVAIWVASQSCAVREAA